MSLPANASPNDWALNRLFVIEGAFSVVGPLISLYLWGGRQPLNELWLGFLAANLVVWSAVGLVGLFLLVGDLVVYGRVAIDIPIRAAEPVAELEGDEQPTAADLLAGHDIPALHVPSAAGVGVAAAGLTRDLEARRPEDPTGAPTEEQQPELVGAELG